MSKMLTIGAAAAMMAAVMLSAPAGAAERNAAGFKNSNRIETSGAGGYHGRTIRHDTGLAYDAARSAYGAYDVNASDPYNQRWSGYDGVNRWGSIPGFNW